MEPKYANGTVITLKSGGRKMTIESSVKEKVEGNPYAPHEFKGNYWCIWFEEGNPKPDRTKLHEDLIVESLDGKG